MLLSSIAISGCVSTKISNLNAYQKIPMQQVELMPSKAALSGEKSRVTLLNLDDSKWPGAGEDVSDKIRKELNSTNNVVIVDRALASRLAQEIQLAETKGRTGYKGQDVADFSISGKITVATTSVKFSADSSYKDKEGKYHHVPATCTSYGQVAISLKIVQLPSLEVIKTIDEEASASHTQDAPGQTHWTTSCPVLNEGEKNSIISAAIKKAIYQTSRELKNQFAPAGYVLERKKFEKNNIFKTTLGVNGGGREGLSVEVIRSVAEKNPLTGITSTELIKIADGLISDQIGTGFSYFIIADQEKADLILLGDKVQVRF